VTVSHKAALSLLISVVLFAVVTVLSFTGFFDLVEARFYNPSVIRALNREIGQDTAAIDRYLTELQTRFSVTLEDGPVKNSFLINQTPEDIAARTRLYGLLHESLGGLQSVRFVDAGGSRIHFSTHSPDLLRQDRSVIAYRNYDPALGDIPYAEVEVPEYGSPKIVLDSGNERIVFALPFSDAFDVYRGTALFSLSVRAVAERLILEGRIKVGEDLSIVSAPPGILAGLPRFGREELTESAASVWREGILTLATLDSAASSAALSLISSKTSQGIFVGRLVGESLFSFPPVMKFILLASLFLTLYLTIFLAFNLRQDAMTVVQNRLKQLQVTLIEEYYDHKSDIDLTYWRRELEQRRENVRAELKHGLRGRTEKEANKDIDSFIDKSWDELLAVIGGRQERITANIDEENLRNILNRVLTGTVMALPPSQGLGEQQKPGPKPPDKAEAVEELGDAEAVEELGDAETVEELGDAEAVEELGDAEVVEELGDAEAVEELGDAEAVEELGDAEVVEELGEAEAVEELGDAEAVEELGDAEAAEPHAAKQSNLRLVFGDDDIPTIVETSGLELVDEDVDSVLHVMSDRGKSDNDAEELEELEELDEEPAEETPAAHSGNTIEELASQIEFGPDTTDPGTEAADEQPLDTEFEIVSPFATILSELDKAETSAGKPKKGRKKRDRRTTDTKETKLEELDTNYNMSLVYTPFSGKETINAEPLAGAENRHTESPVVIEERDGVHYINEQVLNPGEEAEKQLDPEFKNLISSVLKKE
jgi:hypothetical protein